MARYLLRRASHMLITLCAMAVLMFFLFRLLPGDPTATVISPALYPKDPAAERHEPVTGAVDGQDRYRQ